MSPTLIPSDLAHLPHVLCGYENATANIQIARIANVDQWFFECVVLPGEGVRFEAPQIAELEVSGSGLAAQPLLRIPCHELRVRQSAD